MSKPELITTTMRGVRRVRVTPGVRTNGSRVKRVEIHTEGVLYAIVCTMPAKKGDALQARRRSARKRAAK